MSMLKLNSADDITLFLKLLAEESVKDARSALSVDPQQKIVVDKIQSDKKIFGKIQEEEEVGLEAEIDSDQPEEAESEAPDSGGTLEVSLDSISDAVKDLRSGRSVDDSKMKEQLRQYFDRLDPLEREALLTFMRAFAGILTGGFQGSDAPDPSEPPSNIKMSGSDSEEEVEVSSEESEEVEAGSEAETDEEEEEVEDSSPPIRAGAPADLSEIRKRVRKLMKS